MKEFNPKDASSLGDDYFEYHDREFDNEGFLGVNKNKISLEGPYTQLKSDGNRVCLYKFNKAKFQTFLFDFAKKVKQD